ncbi:diguanylate cyclase [Duganella sp. FT135W]|uniref:diguanylate cyclase n=2 Tax=Duganella flavida TaxID=2692175 RepID=A0A6L8K0N9_9BURK|nr:GGDEF domain-containing protein [Duganella flavida]MYM21043.1 diguanylate cyclase [Duganella flavida]
MATLMACAMSVVLYSAHLSFPKEIQGMREWAAGLLFLVAGAVLFCMRDTSAIVSLAANASLTWGLGLTLIGTEKLYEVPPSWRIFHMVWIVTTLGIAYWRIIEPNFSARVAVFSLTVLVFYVRQVFLIWKFGEPHFSSRFFGILMSIQTVVVFTRGVIALIFGGQYVDITTVGAFQSLYLAVGHFMILLLTVGFMTVCTRRLQIILERRSTLDPLTEVLNRRGFADIYAKEHALMRREGTFMTMLNIDIDHFKQINDSYGHAVGDRVLVDVAAVISKALRASDHVARFGGEEFVVLLPATGLDRALHITERIQAALRTPRADVPPYAVSFGVACQTSADESLDGILVRADKALYCAKERGRDRYEIAPEAVLSRTGEPVRRQDQARA